MMTMGGRRTLRRWRLRAALLAATAAAVPGSAAADGALVVGVPEGGLRNGFAYGRAIGGSAEETVGRAFNICREQARKQRFDEARCTLIASFKGQCVAVAMDANERWAGWAVAADRESAQRTALTKCGEGAGGCSVHSLDCDR
jgi:hypothetical protein